MTKKQTTESSSLASTLEIPSAIELVGPAFRVFAQASFLIRSGFMFSPTQPPEIFASTGHAIILLVPGNPEQSVVDAAKEVFNDALLREHYEKLDSEKRAAADEKEKVEQAAKAATKAALVAQIASQQESLRQLQATLTAA